MGYELLPRPDDHCQTRSQSRFATVQASVLACFVMALSSPAPVLAVEHHAGGETARKVLRGGVQENVVPFYTDGTTGELPTGAEVSLTLNGNVNSELNKVGDDVYATVTVDVKKGDKVVLPGQWYVHGKVSEAQGQRRLGRDGFVTIKFDKLISPDGKYAIPFDAEASTKDKTIKSVARVVAKDSVYMSKGAIGGAVMSVEMGGLPLAITTHGISVGIGATAGALVGVGAALARKGKIASALPGEELKFRICSPIKLPAFKPEFLPSAQEVRKIANFELLVRKFEFLKDPFDDKRSRLLRVTFAMDNRTDREYSFGNVIVISSRNHQYYPYVLSYDSRNRLHRVAPSAREEATLTFGVDDPKQKYWLVLLDRGNISELTRVPIN